MTINQNTTWTCLVKLLKCIGPPRRPAIDGLTGDSREPGGPPGSHLLAVHVLHRITQPWIRPRRRPLLWPHTPLLIFLLTILTILSLSSNLHNSLNPNLIIFFYRFLFPPLSLHWTLLHLSPKHTPHVFVWWTLIDYSYSLPTTFSPHFLTTQTEEINTQTHLRQRKKKTLIAKKERVWLKNVHTLIEERE